MIELERDDTRRTEGRDASPTTDGGRIVELLRGRGEDGPRMHDEPDEPMGWGDLDGHFGWGPLDAA